MVLGLYDRNAKDPDLDIFLDAFQVSFPILLDTQTTYASYNQSGASSPFPLDYVIDQDGRVAYFNTEYDPDSMVAVIDGLLMNPSPVDDVPGATSVLQLEVRPNPFNPRTEIRFDLPRSGPVDLDIHDAGGRLVRRLVNGHRYEAGPGTAAWDGTDDLGRALPSGLYLARIRAGGIAAISKLTLLR